MTTMRLFWQFYHCYLICLLLLLADSQVNAIAPLYKGASFFDKISLGFSPTLNTKPGLRAQDPFGNYSVAEPFILWKLLGNELLKHWPPHEIPFFDKSGVLDQKTCINPLKACYRMPIISPTEIAEKWTCFERFKHFLTHEYTPPPQKTGIAPRLVEGLNAEIAYLLALANMFALEGPENIAGYFQDQLRFHRLFNPRNMRQWDEQTINNFEQSEFKLFCYSVYFESEAAPKTNKLISSLLHIYSLLVKANPENHHYLFNFLWASLRYQRPVAPQQIEQFESLTALYHPQPDWLWLKAHIAINQSDWETALFWVYELQERFGNYEDVNALHEFVKTYVQDDCVLPIEAGTISQLAIKAPTTINDVNQLFFLYEQFSMAAIERELNNGFIGPMLPPDFASRSHAYVKIEQNPFLIITSIFLYILHYLVWRQQWQPLQALVRSRQCLREASLVLRRVMVQCLGYIKKRAIKLATRFAVRLGAFRDEIRCRLAERQRWFFQQWEAMRQNLATLLADLRQQFISLQPFLPSLLSDLKQLLSYVWQMNIIDSINLLGLLFLSLTLPFFIVKFLNDEAAQYAAQQKKKTRSLAAVPSTPSAAASLPASPPAPPVPPSPPPRNPPAQAFIASFIKAPIQIIACHEALLQTAKALTTEQRKNAVCEFSQKLCQLYYLALFDKLLALIQTIRRYNNSHLFVFADLSGDKAHAKLPSIIEMLHAPLLNVATTAFCEVVSVYEQVLATARQTMIAGENNTLLLAQAKCPIVLPAVDISSSLVHEASPQAVILFYLALRLFLNDLRANGLPWLSLEQAVIRGAIIKIGLAYAALCAETKASLALADALTACLKTCQDLASFFIASNAASDPASKTAEVIACDEKLMRLAPHIQTALST